MIKIEHETVANMLSDLGLPAEHNTLALQKLANADSRFIKDLKLNVSSVLGSVNFSKKETSLLALSVAINEKQQALMEAFEAMARNNDASDADIADTYACVAIMNTNNIFYRFRHYMHENEFYNKQPAGLRMSSMMNPVLGKELFEMMSLVVSALNGCERCVTSHEHSVKQHGATEPRIYDAMRLAGVIKSLCLVV